MKGCYKVSLEPSLLQAEQPQLSAFPHRRDVPSLFQCFYFPKKKSWSKHRVSQAAVQVAAPVARCVWLCPCVGTFIFSQRKRTHRHALKPSQKNVGCTRAPSAQPRSLWTTQSLFTLLASLLLLRKNFSMLMWYVAVFRIEYDIWERQLNEFHKCKCLSQTMSQNLESYHFVFSVVSW